MSHHRRRILWKSRQRINERCGADHHQPFLQVADYYLVGHALAHQQKVVTHEVASPSTKGIRIPNAWISLGVKFMTPCGMLRTERTRFVLGLQHP
jgi:hypothetical protein